VGVAVLEAIGLSAGEERVYCVIVGAYRSSAVEIAGRLGLATSEVEPLLRALLSRRIVSRIGDDYLATPPAVTLGPLLVQGQAELERARAAVTQLSEQYRSNVRLRDSTRLVEVFTGAEAIREQALRLQRGAREEMLFFCREQPFAMTATQNVEELPALARGVGYRVIYEARQPELPGLPAGMAQGLRAGEQVRSIPQLPIPLAIADRATALCPLGDEATGEPTAALVQGTSLLVALIALFECYWDRATPLRLDRGPVEGPLTEDERQLLSLLVGGASDASIARRLQISPRTIHRRLQELMRRADARSRMQLAWQACKLGWLDDQPAGVPSAVDEDGSLALPVARG
jgi:DNA-binding CsgD family transcriptional regulator/DNA-binding MarR family transcriptional regulator